MSISTVSNYKLYQNDCAKITIIAESFLRNKNNHIIARPTEYISILHRDFVVSSQSGEQNIFANRELTFWCITFSSIPARSLDSCSSYNIVIRTNLKSMRGAQAGASTAYGVFVYVLSMSMRNLSQLSLASINLYECSEFPFQRKGELIRKPAHFVTFVG